MSRLKRIVCGGLAVIALSVAGVYRDRIAQVPDLLFGAEEEGVSPGEGARIRQSSLDLSGLEEYEATEAFWQAQESEEARQIIAALDRGIYFFTCLESTYRWDTPGGYAHAYSADFKHKAGRQGRSSPATADVNLPGTPFVGQAYLNAFRATGNINYLRHAERAGEALLLGQLKSGGFSKFILYDREKWADKDRYLECVQLKEKYGRADGGTANLRKYNPALDNPALKLKACFKEKTTQEAVAFLMHLAQVSGRKEFRWSVERGLAFLLQAQHESGGWPMIYPLFESERLAQPDEFCSNLLSFNDDGTNSAIDLLLEAYATYGDKEYLAGALRGGQFILDTQIGNQGGWAQQYDYSLEPAWGRGNPNRKVGGLGGAVEPPSTCSVVTAGVIHTLHRLYLETGDRRYLDSAGKAVEWLKKSEINERTWAEYYDLSRNRPIYIEKMFRGEVRKTGGTVVYERTPTVDPYAVYSYPKCPLDGLVLLDSASLISDSTKRPPWAMEEYKAISRDGREKVLSLINCPSRERIAEQIACLRPFVERIIKTQGSDGRWVSAGEFVCAPLSKVYDGPTSQWAENGGGAILSGEFGTNANCLSHYLNLLRRQQSAEEE